MGMGLKSRYASSHAMNVQYQDGQDSLTPNPIRPVTLLHTHDDLARHFAPVMSSSTQIPFPSDQSIP